MTSDENMKIIREMEKKSQLKEELQKKKDLCIKNALKKQRQEQKKLKPPRKYKTNVKL